MCEFGISRRNGVGVRSHIICTIWYANDSSFSVVLDVHAVSLIVGLDSNY